MSWMNSENRSQAIYVLYGITGIGKSTVAKTLAERASLSNTLGASFFFSRDEDRRKTANGCSQYSHHLARYDKNCAMRINDALEQADAPDRAVQAQFNSLIS